MLTTRDREAIWAPASGIGLEHLHLTLNYQGAVAGSFVIGLEAGLAFRLHYIIRTDSSWRAREVRLALPGSAANPLTLLSDGEGTWTNGEGAVAPRLQGCVDVDITATPFTNTLPIRRLNLQPGASADIDVVYIDVPFLRVNARVQRYTCLERNSAGGLYRFEAPDSNFTADLRVDADGLVIDYPDLFKRLWEK